MRKQVYVNETNKVVVTVLQASAGQRSFKGISRCSDEDTFDVEFGKTLSNARAWLSFNRAMAKNSEDCLNYLKEEQLEVAKMIENESAHLEKTINNVNKIKAELDELIKQAN